MPPFRRFDLHRDQDVSGVSGVGVVADGARYSQPLHLEFADGHILILPGGWCRVSWRGQHRSTVLWPSILDILAVNGHGGATRVVWLDNEP